MGHQAKKLPLQKLLAAVGIAAGVFLVAGLCVYYPTIEFYIKALLAGNTISPVETDEGVSLAVEADTVTPNYSIKEVQGVGGSYLHEDVQGTFRYTLDGVTVYETIEASGISREECVQLSNMGALEDEYSLILIDLTVENINASPRELDDQDYPYYMAVWPDNHMEGITPGRAMMHAGTFTCYSSLHPPMTETSKNYDFFNLEIGEKKQFQLGVLTPKQAVQEKITFLYVGSKDEGKTFELFQDVSAGEETG